MRETVKVERRNGWGDMETQDVPIITKQEILILHPRYIFAQKPPGISTLPPDSYIVFFAENVPKKASYTRGVYAIKVKDFLEVLASLPHFPNKKEGKILRREKQKRGV